MEVLGHVNPPPPGREIPPEEAECERLVALGASRIQRHEPAPPMSAGHIVMGDPEGDEFCLD